MRVKNRKCVRRLSRKALKASGKRNAIAIFAIILTTLLFTSLFTVVMSLNSSYETYQFLQCGGYSHGTFKDVTEEQTVHIAAHPNVKETGVRTVIGHCADGVFAKVPAEISYMDANCTKWSYAEPTTGHAPENGLEIATDTRALELLGVTPELGAEVPLSYTAGDKTQTDSEATSATFTLVGFWEYNPLMPVHYLNISKDYADEIESDCIAKGMQPFRTDLNAMMKSSINIRGQMEQVDTDLGYNWETWDEENSVRIGVNWGYTASQADAGMDPEMIAAMAGFLLLIIFTGYLIIYNIFQISVSGDIRFYGLLKTIGTTPKQIRHIIRRQALTLCLAGIPLGILLGYGIGAALTPVVMRNTTLGDSVTTLSVSPLIFIGSALFSLITVLLSCAKPGRIAAKVSPVEATKYTEAAGTKKKRRNVRGARVHQMAFANLGRNRIKTVLVVISLALSVTLLNTLCTFVNGFDLEKYVSRQTCADFIVSSPDYFRFNRPEEYFTEEAIEEIKANTGASLSGFGYKANVGVTAWTEEEAYIKMASPFTGEEAARQSASSMEHRGSRVCADVQIEGLDENLLGKVTVLEGDLAPLSDKEQHAIAVAVETDDYGNISSPEIYPRVGDTLPVTYIEDGWYIDSRTGEKSDENTPDEYIQYHIEKSHEVEYTVSALVIVPYSMSFRYGILGHSLILPVDRLKEDSGKDVIPMFYLFDTPDAETEAAAESYLASLTSSDLSPLMYESKATVRESFESFQHMFLLMGGLLCAVIGVVGILNFFNAIMTGILSRRREFAVLQSVGMTNRQLKSMLIYEGMFYALGSVAVSLLLSLVLDPLVGHMMNDIFWFFEYHFSLTPVLIMVPVFTLLGWLIPFALYGQASRQSVVERLRETE